MQPFSFDGLNARFVVTGQSTDNLPFAKSLKSAHT
jgi:hypothetical protein